MLAHPVLFLTGLTRTASQAGVVERHHDPHVIRRLTTHLAYHDRRLGRSPGQFKLRGTDGVQHVGQEARVEGHCLRFPLDRGR